MAVIQYSGLVESMKGVYSGSILQGSSGGWTIRDRKSGGGKDSRRWQDQRAIVSSLAGAWRNVSADDKLVWASQTANYPTVDKYGNPRTPSAYELYMRLNATLAAWGQNTLSVPFDPNGLYDFAPFALTYVDAETYNATWFTDLAPAQGYIGFFCSAPVSAGIDSLRVPLKFLLNVSISEGQPYNIYSFYNAEYGNPPAGTKIYCTARYLDSITGESGNPLTDSIIHTG